MFRSSSLYAFCLLVLLAGCEHSLEPSEDPILTPEAASEAMPSKMACQRVNTQYMSTTSDFGASFLPYRTPTQRTLSMTWGIAALDDNGTLLMQAGDGLWGSENDGCSWTQLRALPPVKPGGDRLSTNPGEIAVGIYRITAGSAGRAYAWEDNGGDLLRVDHASTDGMRWQVTTLRSPTGSMHGFGVDAADPLHVRTAGNDGWIQESFDGGVRWRARGVPAMPGGTLGYVIAFDANDIDHAVYGRVSDGGFVTYDGGETWTPSTGLASVDRGRVNLFNAVISSVDGNVVFAMGLDLTESLNNAPSRGRHIYASNDGGMTFTPVLDHLSDGVLLSNGPVMLCDPVDANKLVFLSSSKPVFGGTTFYGYDLGSGSLTNVHNDTIPRIRTLAYSRVSPGSLHAGFDWF